MVFFLYNAVMSDNLEFFLEHELRNNLQDIENAQLDSRLFRRKNIVDLTFEFCEKLCFNAHTRYLALRYSIVSCPSFWSNRARNAKIRINRGMTFWPSSSARFRWGSCLASSSLQSILKMIVVWNLNRSYPSYPLRLKNTGMLARVIRFRWQRGLGQGWILPMHCLSLRTVTNSEIRVFRTVGFGVRYRTPLDSIETLLAILSQRLAFSAPGSDGTGIEIFVAFADC